MNTTEARAAVVESLVRVVPDADVSGLDGGAPLRRELELDSLDFLTFVEHLAGLTGVRIDEVDYPELVSLSSSVAFLTARAGTS